MVTPADRAQHYQAEIARLQQTIEDLRSGRIEVRHRKPDASMAPVDVEGEVSLCEQRIAILRDAVELATASGEEP